MVIGVAMLKVIPGQERSVYHALKRRGDIKNIYHVFGDYDFFIVTQADGIGQLNSVMDNLQDIYNVTSAKTILVGDDNGAWAPGSMDEPG